MRRAAGGRRVLGTHAATSAAGQRDLAAMLAMRVFFAPIYDLEPLTPAAVRVAVLS